MRIIVFLAFMPLLFLFSAKAEETIPRDEPVRILLLDSWNKNVPWQAAFDRGFEAGLKSSGQRYELFMESLDAGRFATILKMRQFKEFLAAKYNEKGIDIVLSESVPAAQFVVKNPDLLPSARRVYSRPGGLDVQGAQVLEANFDFRGAIAEMFRVRTPEALYVVVDSQSPGQKRRLEDFKAALAASDASIPVEYLADLPMDELLDRISRLPENSAIFYLLIIRDGTGRQFVPFKAAKLMASRANAPIFSHWETLMGSGVLGGYMLSGERVGKLTARAIMKPEGKASGKEAFGRYYDWEQMQRWKLRRSQVGADAVIINDRLGPFDAHKMEILSILGALFVFTILSAILAVVVRKQKRLTETLRIERASLEQRVIERQKAEAELARQDQFLNSIIETIPSMIFVKDAQTLTFVRFNKAGEDLLGIPREEMLGKSDRDFFPEEQAAFFLSKDREVLDNREIVIVPQETIETRNHGVRILQTCKTGIYDENGNAEYLLGISEDITERIEAEKALQTSESKFRELTEISPVCIQMFDADGHLTFCNPAHVAVTGFTQEESIGMAIWDFVPTDQREELQAYVRHLATEQPPATRYLSQNLKADGTVIDVQVDWTYLFNADGSLRGFLSMTSDISERLRAERALKELNITLESRVRERTQELEKSHARYQNLVDSLDEHVLFITNEKGETFYVSNAVKNVLGYEPDEFLMRSWSAYMTDTPENEKALVHIKACVRGETPPTFLLEFFHKNGAKRMLEITERPRFDKAGTVVGVEGIAQDITERHRYESQLVAARLMAENASKAKSQFLANMSHEIRTPMNGVIGMLEVLSRSRLSEDDLRMVSSIHHSATNLLGIINDILDFSKIEAGKMGLSESPISVEHEFDAVAGLMDRLAMEKQVDLRLFFDPAIPSVLLGDPLKLRQILTNLLNNAIKFSAGRDRTGRVTLRAALNRQDDQKVHIDFHVSDNGIGMDERTLNRLFKSFEQADGGTTRTYGGTGLGLAISQSLAEIMGGSISVKSTIDQGSVFTLHVPFTRTDADIDRGERPDLEDLPCIIVDEEHQHIEDFTAYLSHAGAHVYAAERLSEAWDMIRNEDFFEPVCVLVVEDPGYATAPEIVNRLLQDAPEDGVRLLDICSLDDERDKRRKLRKLVDNVYQIDRQVLTRQTFLNSVAVTAGRKEIDTTNAEDTPDSSCKAAAQSRAEAIAQGRLILVAEDNQTNRDVIRRQLELLGYAADLAEDGVEAFEKWRRQSYGLVITDLHMPNMDGYDLTTSIRRDERDRELQPTPILALTANALKGEEERCLGLGMNEYLTKPIELEKLSSTLESHLPQRQIGGDIGNGKPAGASCEPVTKTTSIPAEEAVVDPTMLGRMVGDDPELQAELIEAFLESTEGLLDELEVNYTAHDAIAYGNLAHRLKSSVRSFGANKLGTLFADLEKAGKADDWTIIEAREKEVRPAFREVRKFYDTKS